MHSGNGSYAADSRTIQKRVFRLLLLSFGIVLATTGFAKILSGLGDAKVLHVSDPVLGISLKRVITLVGFLEVSIAAFCFLSKNRLTLPLVAWLATMFMAYRWGRQLMGWHKPCNCLGNITDALHIPPQVADDIMKVVLAYLLIGSYGLLIWEWRKARRLRPSEELPVPDV